MGGEDRNDQMKSYYTILCAGNIGCFRQNKSVMYAGYILEKNQFCRDVAVQPFVNHPEGLRGNEHIVCATKLRAWPPTWILGVYEEDTKKGLLVPVPASDQATLLPIVQEWVEPNTMIWTDMSAAYPNLPQLGLLNIAKWLDNNRLIINLKKGKTE
eukprot:gene11715-83_t